MSNNSADNSINRSDIGTLVIDGLFIALVFIATMFINLRLPIAANGGLIHLGNVPLIVGAVLFGRRTGTLSGALGMTFFDLVSGWAVWAPFTLVITGLMGYTIGAMAYSKGKIKTLKIILAILMAAAIKVAGYYLAEAVIYGNWVVPVSSIPGNLIQVGAAAVIALPIIPILRMITQKL